MSGMGGQSTTGAVYNAFPDESFAAMHLVGRAETSSGGRLTFESQSEEWQFRLDAFTASTRLLVVIQSEPHVTAERFDTDREQAARLRLVASELSDRGATAVLAIPALPPDLALDVARRVAKSQLPPGRSRLRFLEVTPRWADSGDPRYHAATGRLVTAVAEIRELIADWPKDRGLSEGVKEAYVELSLDVCLFLVTNCRRSRLRAT